MAVPDPLASGASPWPAAVPEAQGRRWTTTLTEWVGRIGWWLTPLLLLVLVIAGQQAASIRDYRIADFDLSPCVPEAREAWRAGRLPLILRGSCWYLKTSIRQPGMELEGAGLMLFGLHEDAAVYVNGLRLRDLPDLAGQTYQSTMLWMPIGSGVLRPGDNEILIELRARPADEAIAVLRGAYFGPQELLASVQQRHLHLQRDGARLTLVLIAAVLLFLGPIAISRQGDRRHRWFMLALASSSVYVFHFATTAKFLGYITWPLLTHAALAISLWASLRFSAEMLRKPLPAGAWALALGPLCCLAVTALPAFPRELYAPMIAVYRILMLVLVLVLARFWWQGRAGQVRPGGRWFAAAAAMLAILGLYDGLRAMLGPAFPSLGYSLHWGILYLTLLMFVALIFELITALELARRNQRELAGELAARSRELEIEFERRRSAEAERTLADERQRIMRDMHDGVGGQLVALISQVESGQAAASVVAGHLRRTLEDLRLMIDSLDPACADLSVALGMLRGRLVPMLAGLPTTVHWRTAHLPDLPPASPSTVLHVMRILQEALTNALKHAGARSITIAADWTDGELRVTVTDDGRGMPTQGSPGRGLASMRTRAAAIGASLDITTTEAGVSVALALPMRG